MGMPWPQLAVINKTLPYTLTLDRSDYVPGAEFGVALTSNSHAMLYIDGGDSAYSGKLIHFPSSNMRIGKLVDSWGKEVG